VSERKNDFEKTTQIPEIFSAERKTHSFPDLLSVIQNYSYRLKQRKKELKTE